MDLLEDELYEYCEEGENRILQQVEKFKAEEMKRVKMNRDERDIENKRKERDERKRLENDRNTNLQRLEDEIYEQIKQQEDRIIDNYRNSLAGYEQQLQESIRNTKEEAYSKYLNQKLLLEKQLEDEKDIQSRLKKQIFNKQQDLDEKLTREKLCLDREKVTKLREITEKYDKEYKNLMMDNSFGNSLLEDGIKTLQHELTKKLEFYRESLNNDKKSHFKELLVKLEGDFNNKLEDELVELSIKLENDKFLVKREIENYYNEKQLRLDKEITSKLNTSIETFKSHNNSILSELKSSLNSTLIHPKSKPDLDITRLESEIVVINADLRIKDFELERSHDSILILRNQLTQLQQDLTYYTSKSSIISHNISNFTEDQIYYQHKIKNLEREVQQLKQFTNPNLSSIPAPFKESDSKDQLTKWKTTLELEKLEIKEEQDKLERDRERWKMGFNEYKLNPDSQFKAELKMIKQILDKRTAYHNKRVNEMKMATEWLRQKQTEEVVSDTDSEFQEDIIIPDEEDRIIEEWRTNTRSSRYSQTSDYKPKIETLKRNNYRYTNTSIQNRDAIDAIDKHSNWLNSMKHDLSRDLLKAGRYNSYIM